jgi:hypothetical protein
MWEEGKVLLPKKKRNFQAIPRPCRFHHLTYKHRAGVSEGFYRYNDKCELTIYNPIDTDTILQKHLMVFFGDSMLRQLFHRLVWHLRGLEEVVEHYYHGHAIYARNATHDRFVVGEQDIFGQKHTGLPMEPHEVLQNPSILMIFIFEPVLKDTTHVKRLLQPTYLPDYQKVLVSGIHYWLKDRTNDTLIMQSMNDSIAIPPPPAESKRKPVIPIWYPSGATQFHTRHMAFLAYAKGLGYHILPSIELADTKVFLPNRKDQVHYQCAYTTWLHEPLTLDGYKTPPDADCRDLYNLNLIEMSLNILLGMEKDPVIVSSRKLLRQREFNESSSLQV